MSRRQVFWSVVAIAFAASFLVTTATHADAATIAPMAKRMCRPDPPEYPGCTAKQVAQSMNAQEARRHLRGGGFGKVTDKQRTRIRQVLSRSQWRTLKRKYAAAVRRYEQPRGASAAFTRQARYQTWRGFFRDVDCDSSPLSHQYTTEMAMCASEGFLDGKIGGAFKALLQRGAKATLQCGGTVLTSAAGAAATTWYLGHGVIIGAAGGGIGGLAGCMTGKFGDWGTPDEWGIDW